MVWYGMVWQLATQEVDHVTISGSREQAAAKGSGDGEGVQVHCVINMIKAFHSSASYSEGSAHMSQKSKVISFS